MTEEQTPQEPNVPENIEGLLESLYEREMRRRRAIDLARDQFLEAKTEDERVSAAKTWLNMMHVLEEFWEQFPEVFPPQDENQ